MKRALSSAARAWLAGVVALAFFALAPPAKAMLSAGFEDRPVTSGTTEPTALAFTPDGRLLITEKSSGALRIYKSGELLPTPALDLGLRICSDIERGLLGVAVDPSFSTNHYIYLYYTFKKFGACDYQTATVPVNRIARFTLGDDDVVDPASELVLVDNIPSVSGVHNAGSLQFGKDGYLYASVGDSGCDFAYDSGCYPLNDAARDMSGLVGKILRITPSGDIPATNPYQGPGTERCNVNGRATPGNTCQEIFASGLRNPWQIAFDPNDTATRFYINDVGDFRWEEIDVGTAGADYGWNIREGHCARGSLTNCGPPPAGMTNPIYDYLHDYDTGGCSAITGGAFVPAGIWPPAYDGSYLFADFTCGKIARLEPLGGGYSAVDLANQIPLLVSIAFGPSSEGQALYYIRWDSGYYLAGEPGYHIRRIVYTGAANRPPQAGASLKPPASRVPSTVHFSSTGSSDPDGDELSYEWDFDDGSAHSTEAAPDHTYAVAGVYSPKLTVRDGYGGQDSATLTFHAGDDPPAPKINSPSPSKRFRVGERITLRGLATDQEDGTLPDSALRWKVIRHHAAHTHPFLPVTTGNNLEIVAPSPEDIQATTVSKLEIQLTATDSSGVSQTVKQYLLPALVDLSFESDPSGLNLEVAGSTLVTPQTITSWEGWDITATAPEQTDASGKDWLFEDWSDAGGASHTITTPSSASTYTARFKRAFPHPSAAPEVSASLVPVFRQCGTGANPPNGEHSLPLGDDACLPPVGTGTARIGPEAVGSARFEVTPGDLDPGNGNQADVLVTGGMTDVVTQLGADYDPMPLDPDMTLLSRMRITDRSNGASNRDIATTTDLFFPIPVDCAATIDPATGATCSVDTTMNAIAAGAITEGKDAVIQFFRVRLDDAGANGTRGDSDDRIFATQGVYVP